MNTLLGRPEKQAVIAVRNLPVYHPAQVSDKHFYPITQKGPRRPRLQPTPSPRTGPKNL